MANDGNTPVGWVTYSDGSDVLISVDSVTEYIREQKGGNLLNVKYLKTTAVANGIVRLEIDLTAISGDDFDFEDGTSIPIAVGSVGDNALRSDVPYFVLFEDGVEPADAHLFTCTDNALITGTPQEWSRVSESLYGPDGEEATADSAAFHEEAEDGTKTTWTLGDFGLYPDHLFSFRNKSGDYITLRDLLGGLLILQACVEIAKRLKFKQAQGGPLMVRTGKQFTEALRATTKRGTFEREAGGEFVMTSDLMISTERKGELVTNVGMSKTLVLLNALATDSGYKYGSGANCVVTTSVEKILESRGLPVTRKHSDAVRRDVKNLSRWSWEWENKKGEWIRVPLSGGRVIIKRGGEIEFSISADFMGAVLDGRAGLMPENPLLLKTDDKRHPLAFVIGTKLTTHTYQNYGKQNQSTLSVERLLEYVQDLPTAEEIKANRGSTTQKIIAPVERDLNHLVELGVLKWWDYCHAKGEPLEDAEQDMRLDAEGEPTKPLPYDVATKCNIQWELSEDYAEQMAETVKARERNREEALRAKEERAARKKSIQSRVDGRIAKGLAERELAKMDAENAPSKSQEAR